MRHRTSLVPDVVRIKSGALPANIVNNFLNHFQLIKIEVEDEGTVKKETLKLLDESIEETSQQLKILEEIREPDKKESYNGIYPK